VVITGLWITGRLFVASVVVRVGGLGRFGVPASILAGLIGLGLGADGLGLVGLDRGVLESIVYHGLGVVFIAVSLQSPPATGATAGSTSIAFAIPVMGGIQGLLGLLAVLVIGGLHPGLGLLAPYGFEQGPGQALAVGSAWESMGLADGAQIGLIYAALGFLWSVVVGIPLVAIGRARGWLSPPTPRAGETAAAHAAKLPAGTLEVLTGQVVAIGVVYLLTYFLLKFLVWAFAGLPDIAAMFWGFHFIGGALIALPVRAVLARRPADNPLDDETLGRIGGLAVDVVTCAALAAVDIGVLKANLGVLLLVSTLAGAVTLWLSVWLARRAFPEEPFEHGLVLFGMATGTLPVGLALLRMIDPELRGSVPSSCVIGSVASTITAAPLYLVVLSIPVQQWPDGYPGAGWLTVGILAVYLVALFVGWRLIGPLRFLRPLLANWPDRPR